MSPFEICLIRFIFFLDGILAVIFSHAGVLSVCAIIFVCLLFGQRIIRRRAGLRQIKSPVKPFANHLEDNEI